MILRPFVPFARALAALAAAVTLGGCEASVSSRAPIQVGDVSVAERVFEAHRLGAGCSVGGERRVVAQKVAPYAGIDAQADASRVVLRFADPRSKMPKALAVNPRSLDAADGSVSEQAKLGAPEERGETGGAMPVLWQPQADEDSVQLPFVRESAGARTSRPVVARVDSERSVAVWNAGSIYDGEDVRIMMVDRHGSSLGYPVTLTADGRAFGTPTVAIASSGQGVVAFVQSTDRGFELVVASIDCYIPAAPENAPVWATKD